MAKKTVTKSGLFTQVVETENNKVFFGKFLEQHTDGCRVVTKNDVTKHYESYEELSGILEEVYCYKKDLGNNKHLEMLVVNLKADDGTTESVSVPFDSGYAQSFIQRLENINRGEVVALRAYCIKDTAKSAAKGVEVFNKFLIPLQMGINKNGVKDFVPVENKYKAIFAEGDTEKKKNLNKNVLPKFDEIKTKENGKPVTKYNSDNFKEALRDIVKAQNAAYKNAAAEETKVETSTNEDPDFAND